MTEPESVFLYEKRTPALLVIDDFYKDPDKIRRLALEQEYGEDLRFFKGQRSRRNWLFPYVKEEFERLLGVEIADWMQQGANGCFQKTTNADPLVWHSDSQDYAAAIYLTPEEHEIVRPGTSFWQHKHSKARRPPENPELYAQTYTPHDLLHPDNWNLVDRVGAVYNRLVLWNAQLIHSASGYETYTSDNPRLVQLFFFNIIKR